jgi:hypothetical protein
MSEKGGIEPTTSRRMVLQFPYGDPYHWVLWSLKPLWISTMDIIVAYPQFMATPQTWIRPKLIKCAPSSLQDTFCFTKLKH